jgi:hypothetical protein
MEIKAINITGLVTCPFHESVFSSTYFMFILSVGNYRPPYSIRIVVH